MNVEHLTLGGASLVRDTKDIHLSTINLLKDFKIREGTVKLPFPNTDFTIKVSAAGEGAIFDIMLGHRLLCSNVCGFESEFKHIMCGLAAKLAKGTLFSADIIREPELDQFIYTVPVDIFAATPEQLQIAGEIELYIYYLLYLARKD